MFCLTASLAIRSSMWVALPILRKVSNATCLDVFFFNHNGGGGWDKCFILIIFFSCLTSRAKTKFQRCFSFIPLSQPVPSSLANLSFLLVFGAMAMGQKGGPKLHPGLVW